MISTAAMICLGRIEDNRMIHMQLTNEKLIDRGVRILMERGKLMDYEKVKSVLLKEGSVSKAWSVLEKLNSEC
jgi:N-acetylmuramic acid 6-phosphate etherase